MLLTTNLPKYIYHYCTISTFSDIVENGTIRLSDIRKSNDSKEIVWFMESFRGFISKKLINALSAQNTLTEESINILNQLRNVSSEIQEKNELDNRLSVLNEQIGIEKNFVNNFERLNNFFKDNYWLNAVDPYVFCLSSYGDSLSQWRGYGDDGYGVSIGFNMSYFERIITNSSSLMIPYNSLSLSEVCYKEDLDSLFEMVIKKVPSFYDEIEMEPDSILFLMLLQILSIAPLFKNPSFVEESEWRLLSLMKSLNIDKLTKFDNSFWNEHTGQTEEIKSKFQLLKKDYFIRDKTLVPFLELKISNLSEAIGEIVIGPKSKITISEMKDYLLLKGLKTNSMDDIHDGVNVIKSKSSYTDKP